MPDISSWKMMYRARRRCNAPWNLYQSCGSFPLVVRRQDKVAPGRHELHSSKPGHQDPGLVPVPVAGTLPGVLLRSGLKVCRQLFFQHHLHAILHQPQKTVFPPRRSPLATGPTTPERLLHEPYAPPYERRFPLRRVSEVPLARFHLFYRTRETEPGISITHRDSLCGALSCLLNLDNSSYTPPERIRHSDRAKISPELVRPILT